MKSKAYFKKVAFFSLIEMIVAFAIVAIFMTLLQPSLKKLLSQSESLTCSTVLRKSMLGAIYYDEDHEWYPAPILEMQTTRNIPNWNTLWYKVMEDGGYTEGQNPKKGCPTEKAFNSEDSYAINQMNIVSSRFDIKLEPIREVAFGYQISSRSTGSASPDRLLFLADHQAGSSGWMHFAIRTSDSMWDGTHRYGAPPDFRHFGTKNAAFLDGHVAPHGPGEFEAGLYLR